MIEKSSSIACEEELPPDCALEQSLLSNRARAIYLDCGLVALQTHARRVTRLLYARVHSLYWISGALLIMCILLFIVIAVVENSPNEESSMTIGIGTWIEIGSARL